MPVQTYAQKKPHIAKWVANNKEKYYEIQYRNTRRYRLYQSQAKILRKILINLI